MLPFLKFTTPRLALLLRLLMIGTAVDVSEQSEIKDNVEVAGLSVPLRLLSLIANLLEESSSLFLFNRSSIAIPSIKDATEDSLPTPITTFKQREDWRQSLIILTLQREETLEAANSTLLTLFALLLVTSTSMERLACTLRLQVHQEDPSLFVSMLAHGKTILEEF